MKRYLIAGNGVAAVGCIEGIRSVDPNGEILVVSQEKHPVYCRPLISYYLEGKTDLDRMQYRTPDFYEKMGCRVCYGDEVVELNPTEKKARLQSGETVDYDAVCVATGSSPFVPSFPGLDTVEKAFSFLTLDDALALDAAVEPDTRVLIMGAGLIGLKCAEGLRDRVAEITVCDLADHVLSSVLDADAAAILQQHLEDNGIRFCLGDTAASFQGNTAKLQKGGTLPFDVLVLAVGVRPNTGLVRESGGAVDRGILVDDRMATSLPDVYAAGDCTQGEDASCGQKRVLAILPNAYMQGFTAGANMAGGDAVFDNAIPMNAVGFFGLHALTAGSYNGEMYEEKAPERLKRLFTRDGYLVGFILIGDTDRAGIYTAMIRDRVPLDTVNFELLQKTATSAAFSQEIRRKNFGGVV